MSVVTSSDTVVTLPQTPTPETPLAQTFCIELFADNDEAITFYTSFPTYSHLMICYEFLGNAVNHLNYHLILLMYLVLKHNELFPHRMNFFNAL